MFCPKCATQNMDGARFCRACGVDISLVPQAMSGTLTQTQAADLDALNQTGDSIRRRRRRQRGEPGLDRAIKNIFTGLAFLAVTIVLAFTPMGRGWWFWMFFPAFATLGGGVAELIRLKIEQRHPSFAAAPAVAMPPLQSASELPPRSTSELMPQPPSVTEGTTRHLGSEGPTEYLATPRGKSEKKV
jgi:zinc-ribbon domain